MSSHGGAIGLIVAAYWYSYWHRYQFLHLLDIAGLLTPLGASFVRLGNFINGEMYGKPCSPSFPLAMKFPLEIQNWSTDRLVALSDLVQYVGVEPIRWNAWLLNQDKYGRQISAGKRSIIEAVQSGNPDVVRLIEPLLTPRYPAQLIQAALECFLVFVILAILWSRPRKPGIVTAWALMLYGTTRILTSFIRAPESEGGVLGLGLTESQWLSVVMLLAGVNLFVFVLRRPAEKLPGWLGPIPVAAIPLRSADIARPPQRRRKKRRDN